MVIDPSVMLPPGFELRPIGPDQRLMDGALSLCIEAFLPAVVSQGWWKDDPERGIRDDCVKHADRNLSHVVIHDGSVVAAYLLKPDDREDTGALDLLDDGVEGVALVVSPAFRGMGIGRALKSLPEAMGASHVVGSHLKALGNLDRWLATREVIAEKDDLWVTLRVFRTR